MTTNAVVRNALERAGKVVANDWDDYDDEVNRLEKYAKNCANPIFDGISAIEDNTKKEVQKFTREVVKFESWAHTLNKEDAKDMLAIARFERDRVRSIVKSLQTLDDLDPHLRSVCL